MATRRSVDLSMPIDCSPGIDTMFPPNPPSPHKEALGPERKREDAMFLLRIQPTQFGDPPLDWLEQVTFSVDPAGTHLETYYPERFFYGGVNPWTVRDVAHFPIKQLVNDAVIVEARDMDRAFTPEDLEKRAKHLKPGDGMLLHTATSNRWRNPGLQDDATIGKIYGGQQTGLTVAAAKWLTQQEVGICGFDCRSPEDPKNNWNLKTHEELLTHNVLLCEDMANFDHLTQERVLLIGGTPLKGRHLTGTASRMVALERNGDGSFRPVDLTHILGCYPQRSPIDRIRTELPEQRDQVTRRMDVMWFDMSEHGIGDSTGPQYIRFSTQTGTHLLNPLRRVGGKIQPLFEDVTAIAIDRLVRPGSLVDLSHIGPRQVIRAADIRAHGDHIAHGDWVYLRTDYTDWHRESPTYLQDSPVLSPEAVAELARRGAVGIVTDLAQLAPLEERWEMYAALAENNLLAVEGAWHLWLIRKQRFQAAVLPLNIKGLVTSPVHVFAIEEWT